MEKKFFAVLLSVLIVLTVFIAGCIEKNPGAREFREIPRFESYDAMVAAFNEARTKGRNYGVMDAAVRTVTMPLAMPLMSVTSAGESVDASAGDGSGDFSTTNVQVEGVDEADIVKSDGKFIYNFSKNNLVITDAYPIESARIVSKTELKDIYPVEMFVNGEKLVLFGNKSNAPLYMQQMGMEMPYYYGGGKVAVQLFDVSDRSNPVLEKDFEFEGSYLTSRMIGKNAYFVVNSYPKFYPLKEGGEDNIIPLMSEDGVERKIAGAQEIGFLPPMPPQSFVTLASINIDSKSFESETIAASAESVFASMNNIYLASTVFLPPDTPVVGEVEKIISGDRENTVINKFGLDNGKIGFVGQGSVPGHVLNQFSMDEFEGKFRIATTLGQVWDTLQQSQNNLFVLDEEMDTIGKLEGLAPGEKIYSARFMGNRGYLVTFKKVDPLFVIDLSEPSNPRVLGKLKIPGYSDYLHPIDETHIIGVGKDTIEASDELIENRGFGFAWYQGLKLAVFDVSDVEHPKELHKIVIGDRGTDSYALHDHKAFLYDKEKELLVLPVTLAEIPAEQKKPLVENQRSPSYGEQVFQGAFVFRLTLENGFEERGRITHISAEEELKRGYYFSNDSSVKRALFIGNVLYTLSDKMLKANTLDTLVDLKEFVFE